MTDPETTEEDRGPDLGAELVEPKRSERQAIVAWAVTLMIIVAGPGISQALFGLRGGCAALGIMLAGLIAWTFVRGSNASGA
jgi:hypothetical protein